MTDFVEQHLEQKPHPPRRGYQLFPEGTNIVFVEDEKGEKSFWAPSLPTPLGELKLGLRIPSKWELYESIEPTAQSLCYAITPSGKIIEDTIENLIKQGFLDTSFYLKSVKKRINALERAILWFENTEVLLIDDERARGNWGMDTDIENSEADFADWETLEGELIGTPWLPNNPDFLSRMRLSFESIKPIEGVKQHDQP